MFNRGISILGGTSVDPGNIPVPRPFDALEEACAAQIADALNAESEFMTLSERLSDPNAYRRVQRDRRRQLERFLWADANQASLRRMLDLIAEICEELSWSAEGDPLDDPLHPGIDRQAAETGALLAWVLRRHGARLKELNPRIPNLMLGEARRRLLAPVAAHEDYPFMRGRSEYAGLILCDLLLTALLMERTPTRRMAPVKKLLHCLDALCAQAPGAGIPYAERLTDACAVADLARLIKRLTRGEVDFTRETPPEGWLDDALLCWAGGEYFFDPAGENMTPDVAGVDLFRLGYLTNDRALCALGAQLNRLRCRESASVTGRILSMEYMRAMQDEISSPPRLKRAINADGSLMIARCGGFTAGVTSFGARGNAGSVSLFAGSAPILIDAGGQIHSLPLPDGRAPLIEPKHVPPLDNDFSDERDLMSADLTDIYPESFGVTAYQRTLMLMRLDGVVRLVDALEFSRQPEKLVFRFVTAPHPIPLKDRVLLGQVTLKWDGEMTPAVEECAGGHLLTLTMPFPPKRLICGFSFEMN